eukprot:4678121-Pleurochrysis_carterae.AAC.5
MEVGNCAIFSESKFPTKLLAKLYKIVLGHSLYFVNWELHFVDKERLQFGVKLQKRDAACSTVFCSFDLSCALTSTVRVGWITYHTDTPHPGRSEPCKAARIGGQRAEQPHSPL